MRMYHGCRETRWWRFVYRIFPRRIGLPRLVYWPNTASGPHQDTMLCSQMFVCERCFLRVYVDTDRVDVNGGFLGECVQYNPHAEVLATRKILLDRGASEQELQAHHKKHEQIYRDYVKAGYKKPESAEVTDGKR